MNQDLSEVKVGPNFSEDQPEKKGVDDKKDLTVKDAELLQSGAQEDESVADPEDLPETNPEEKEDILEEEEKSECASSVAESESQMSETSSHPGSSVATDTILSMLPDDISETAEEEPESKHQKLDKKIKQMKRFLSGTLKKRKELAQRVRDSIDNPSQTEVKTSLRKKKGNKRKRGHGITERFY